MKSKLLTGVCGLGAVAAGVYLGGVVTAQVTPAPAPASIRTHVAFVNMQEVLKVYPKYKELQGEVKKREDVYVQTIKNKQDRLEALRKEYVDPKTMQQRKDAIEAEVRVIQVEMENIKQDAIKQNGKFFDEQVAAIYNEFHYVVGQVAATNGFDVVLRFNEDWTRETYAKPESVVRRMTISPFWPEYYNTQTCDITYRVSEELNKRCQVAANAAPTAPVAGGVQQTGAVQQPK